MVYHSEFVDIGRLVSIVIISYGKKTVVKLLIWPSWNVFKYWQFVKMSVTNLTCYFSLK